MKLTIRRIQEAQIDTDAIRAYFDHDDSDEEILRRLADDNGQYTCLVGDVGGWQWAGNMALLGWWDKTP